MNDQSIRVADRTRFRCRICRERKELHWKAEKMDLPIVIGPTGEAEFEAVCHRCGNLQRGHARRRLIHRPDQRIQQELNEMCRLRDEIRRSGVDLRTACAKAAELSTAAADPLALVEFLKTWTPQ